MPARPKPAVSSAPWRTGTTMHRPVISPNASARREAIRVVHIAAECCPFARTGGLGEMVSTLASHHGADGLSSAVIMPYYRQVADRVRDLERVCTDVVVSLGDRVERISVWRAGSGAQDHHAFFIDHPSFSERGGLYGEAGQDYPDNAERFALFCMAALTVLPRLAPASHIVHAHDWHAALVPVYLQTAFATSAFHRHLAVVLSVHNVAFQGHASPELMPALGLPYALYDWRLLEWYGRINLLKGGLAFADVVTTVSPTHARELVTPDGGFGLHDAFAGLGERLVGIVNGLDQGVWNPATDQELAARYTPSSLTGKRRCKAALQRAFGLPERDDIALVAMCARLTAQKGIDLVLESDALSRDYVQVVVLGEGEERFAHALRTRAAASSDRIAVHTTFCERLEHLLMGGADIFLMPSRYEPCGLAQLRAQRYGALPVAHRVGGLADTIEDGATGFLFDEYTPAALSEAIDRALSRFAEGAGWHRMMRAAMMRDFGWSRSAHAYRDVYRRATDATSHRREESCS